MSRDALHGDSRTPPTRTVMVGFLEGSERPIAFRSVQVDDVMVERAARKLATDFGYEDVFLAADDGEMVQEMYDADYWRMLARNALTVALDA